MTDPSTPLTRLHGVAVIVGPACLTASSVAYLVGAGFPRDALGGLLQVYASAILAIALLGLVASVRLAMPRWAALLVVTTALGTTGGAVFGVDAIFGAAGAPQRINELGTLGSLASDLPGILFPLSLVGLGIALLRTRSESWNVWNAAGLVVAGVLFPVGRIGTIDALAVVGDLILLTALAPIGVGLLRVRQASTARG